MLFWEDKGLFNITTAGPCSNNWAFNGRL